ncbi:MAG: 1-(5-phosphoribosyl)-5-[(5-phosphoribosylamino)methylideneamino]imidazole-4-carboxamide isomerase [Ruminococcus sp.]|nr:1-(5-phosphoribosyl)-5-[(5-phosphoribosylamino)methylideneamino]imidazole-4-carboxamide isomerase [Ruminococcus sp.]
MYLFPAIDLIGGQAVRLVKGDYNRKTVYSSSPVEVAKSFYEAGAEFLHVVDLDGAKSGNTDNISVIADIIKESGLKVEVGGGIRSEEVIRKYIDSGVYRVILGTVAVENPDFCREMTEKYGDKIAVGVDIKDGFVAIKGWTEVAEKTCFDFCKELEEMGVKTVICTDISKDGLLSGTNLELYRELQGKFNIDFTASGGVTSLDDVKALMEIGVYGAILGKALYTGNIDLKEAVALTKEAK